MMKNQASAFIPASELKKHFDVFGFFYDIRGSRYRSCLEIVRKNHKSVSNLLKGIPDAIITMMNPGSSRPLNEEDKPHVVSSFSKADILLVNGKLIHTHPDSTQYQIERLMLRMNWEHVRVINLSDIRQPKSHDFIKSILSRNDAHSIFSESRRNTLDILFQAKTVVCGWGIDSRLGQLANPAIKYLAERRCKIIGQPADSDSNFYRHPSPMIKKWKMAWLDDVELQLKY
jgi:hypothetical protein